MAQPQGKSNVAIAVQVVFDGFIYVVVIGLVYVLHTFVRPTRRGVFCGDVSVALPGRADTVSDKQLLFCAVFIPTATIVLLELYSKVIQGRNCSGRLRQCLISSFKLTCMFVYGAALTLLVTMTLKTLVGRLRPHFLETCRPDLARYNCTDPANSFKYIADVTCADDVTPEEEADARASFPSGHASLVAYAAAFLVIYIEDRLTITFSVLLKSLAQVVVALLAVYVIVSRLSDNRHHASDVIAGALLGLLIAVYVVLCVSHHFRHESCMAPSGGGEVVAITDLSSAPSNFRRQKSVGAESTLTARSVHSDALLP